MRLFFRRIVCSLLYCFLVFVSLNPLKTFAATGLGVSGAFAGSVFTMVAGETLNSQNISVSFFNTSSASITVKLSGEGPQGTRYFFEQETQVIAANGQLSVPVSFQLSPMLAQGTYPISIRADLISEASGLKLSGFAQLSASVNVLGEAGDVRIVLKDLRNNLFQARLTLSRIEEGKVIALYESESGEMNQRLVPGHYRISATYQDTQVVQKDFVLKDKDRLSIDLIAQTVFVKTFMMGANLDSQGKIQSAKIVYTIRNIHRPEPGAKLILSVTKNSHTVEEIPMMTLPELMVGELSGRFTYYPKDGWSNGNIGFSLIVKTSDDLILAESETQTLLIDTPSSFSLDAWMIIGSVSLPILGLWIVKSKKK